MEEWKPNHSIRIEPPKKSIAAWQEQTSKKIEMHSEKGKTWLLSLQRPALARQHFPPR
jgi:hypothetical protein